MTYEEFLKLTKKNLKRFFPESFQERKVEIMEVLKNNNIKLQGVYLPGTKSYAGYFITAVTRINNLAQRYEGGCEFPEVIITNYDPGERERSKPRQLDLFGMWGDGETDHYEIREEICPEREVL